MKKLIGIVWLILSISSCDLHQEVIAPPAKPEGVPELAFWIGDPEGGVFILISNKQGNGAYFGTVYFDKNGKIWYQGQFQYSGDAPFEVANPLSYTGWDGDFLFLANGEKLMAVGEGK